MGLREIALERADTTEANRQAELARRDQLREAAVIAAGACLEVVLDPADVEVLEDEPRFTLDDYTFVVRRETGLLLVTDEGGTRGPITSLHDLGVVIRELEELAAEEERTR